HRASVSQSIPVVVVEVVSPPVPVLPSSVVPPLPPPPVPLVVDASATSVVSLPPLPPMPSLEVELPVTPASLLAEAPASLPPAPEPVLAVEVLASLVEELVMPF